MDRGEMITINFLKTAAVLIIILCSIIYLGCKNRTPEERKYIAVIEEQRKNKDIEMKNDPGSPFNRDPKTHYAPLKYFEPDPEWVFKSRLTRYNTEDTVITFGTKGEERKAVKIGYITFSKQAQQYKINVYKGFSKTGQEYYSLWFTDRTTGVETYGVGRYLDFELNNDPDFIYTIDFNLAYSPYCSYSSIYSCAIPTKDNYLDLKISAGEKKFHD